MKRATFIVGALLASACADPASGTFVGNPSMSVRLSGNEVQQVQRGRLDALEVHVTDCDAPPLPLGPTSFIFEGADSADVLNLPVGQHCGLFFVVDHFTVEFNNEGGTTIIRTDGFDLDISAGFAATWGRDFLLQLGDREWLAEVAAMAGPGEYFLNSELSELRDVFLGGLQAGSTVVQWDGE